MIEPLAQKLVVLADASGRILAVAVDADARSEGKLPPARIRIVPQPGQAVHIVEMPDVLVEERGFSAELLSKFRVRVDGGRAVLERAGGEQAE